jgi:dihydrofolate reductase
MTRILSAISMSLDGYITGKDDNHEHPMGIGGERLHDWLFNQETAAYETNARVMRDLVASIGAVVIGRRMFDLGEEPWGRANPFDAPLVVTTHRENAPIEAQGKPPITFVTGGLDAALDRARQMAGDRDILIAGGADIIRQAIAAGYLDELMISLVPILLGNGKPLFDAALPLQAELEPLHTLETPTVTHLRYRVLFWDRRL